MIEKRKHRIRANPCFSTFYYSNISPEIKDFFKETLMKSTGQIAATAAL